MVVECPTSLPVVDTNPPATPASLTDCLLQSIDAMEQNEDLTDLGFHLADLPVEPHLGKMVLCAVVLKCLDPILTIACMLAYRDPFVLPAEGAKKKAALHCRKHFASSSFSDHMALLRAFQVGHDGTVAAAAAVGTVREYQDENGRALALAP